MQSIIRNIYIICIEQEQGDNDRNRRSNRTDRFFRLTDSRSIQRYILRHSIFGLAKVKQKQTREATTTATEKNSIRLPALLNLILLL